MLVEFGLLIIKIKVLIPMKKIVLFFILIFPQLTFASEIFKSNWENSPDRIWVGKNFWANRLQDWRVQSGKLICVEKREIKPMRTVHLLTARLGSQKGDLKMSVKTGLINSKSEIAADSACGFLVGAGRLLDYRAASLIHHSPGPGGGLFCGLNGKGELFILDFSVTNSNKVLAQSKKKIDIHKNILLSLSAKPVGTNYTLSLACSNIKTGKKISEIFLDNVETKRLEGNLALVSHPGTGKFTKRHWFQNWKVSGGKLEKNDTGTFGPVICTQHTLSREILKLTAQFMPVGNYENNTAKLQIKITNIWKTVGVAKLFIPSWTATFRVENWNDKKDTPYRVSYELVDTAGKTSEYFYGGIVRKNPVNKNTIVVAAFTGNQNTRKFGVDRGYFDWQPNSIWFPHNDIVKNTEFHNPDLLFFSGDQVYESSSPTTAEKKPLQKAVLDYLYKWYLWCWAYGDLTKNIPTVTIPDDHDVFQGNLWGAGGRHIDVQEKGGFVMPAEFVKVVDRTQTSHLPDPYDPAPIKQGIDVYYCSMNYGGISYAIIEDRKFKFPCNIKQSDGKWKKQTNPDLLGERQLNFLSEWVTNWSYNAKFKVLLSQTIFSLVSTASTQPRPKYGGYLPLPPDVYPKDTFRHDVDSNASNPEARDRALKILRKGFVFHIAGDTHLATLVHYGINNYNDASFAFCVPSIANYYPRRWYPPVPGKNRKSGMPKYTGEFTDLYGNKMTVFAVANPVISGQEPEELCNRSPGYGIIKFNKSKRTITMECWPRWENPAKRDAKQYPGWPLTINQADNYGRESKIYLPTIETLSITNPVVQIINEKNNEIVYTLRINGNTFKPKVFEKGSYTIKISDPDRGEETTIKNIKTTNGAKKIKI